MKTKININKRLSIWAVIVSVVLMIPFVTKAPWTKGDYIFAGLVLMVLVAIYEFLTRNKSKKHRFAVGLGFLIIVALILGWAATGPD